MRFDPKKFSCLLFSVFLVLLCMPTWALTLYVARVAAGSGNGSSWMNATADIQGAIGQVSAAGGGEVLMNAYTDTSGNYYSSKHIHMANGVTIGGGYYGAYDGDTRRDTSGNPSIKTVITGTGSDCIVEAPSSVTDPSTSVIEYVTLKSGTGHVTGSVPYGGAIYCAGSPTIRYCYITANSARYGGGIYAASGALPEILNNTIISNNGNGISFGVGVYMYAGRLENNTINSNRFVSTSYGNQGGGVFLASYSSAPTFLNNIIAMNGYFLGTGTSGFASSKGGGVYLTNCDSSLVMSGNTIGGNQAGNGAGVYASSAGKLVDNYINQNYALVAGAGVYASSSFVVEHNTITMNTCGSNGSGQGAGIYYDGTGYICRNTITSNVTYYCGGGIYWSATVSKPGTVFSNVIVANSATTGAGVYATGIQTTSRFANNTVVGHTAGSGIYLNNPASGSVVANCIIKGNSPFGIAAVGSGNCLLTYSSLYGNAADIYGNVTMDPSCLDGYNPLLDSNYRITDDSPCYNAGDDSKVSWDWLDMDGKPRIVGTHVDIGASEFARVEAPSFTPGGGYFNPPINVYMQTNTQNATIRYTTDGTAPTGTSTLYDPGNPPLLTGYTVLKARAFKPYYADSDVTTATYTPQVATPYFNPDGSNPYYPIFPNPVTIYCDTPGATIHYTTNGTTPTSASPVYASPVMVDHIMTLKAIACYSGYVDSDVASELYDLTIWTGYMHMFPPDGSAAGTVTLSCEQPNVTIRYTIDGTDPTGTSPVYTYPIVLTGPTTVKARGYETGWNPSDVISGTYSSKVATPVLTGLGSNLVKVECATPGATIHYTTNDVDPTQTDPTVASGSNVTISGQATLKAKAWKTGYTPSNIAWGYYNGGTRVEDMYDWLKFMHDQRHTGLNPYPDSTTSAFGTTGAPVWTANVGTSDSERTEGWSDHRRPGVPEWFWPWVFEHPVFDSSPVVVGNEVIVGEWTRGTDYFSATGSVKAFNASTGALLWSRNGSGTGFPTMGGVASTPCVWHSKIYVGTTNGYLYCLDLNGNIVWASQTTDRTTPAGSSKIISSPVVYQGVVYIGNEAAKMCAFNAATGAVISGYPVVLPIETWDTYTLAESNMTGITSAAVARTNGVDYLLFGSDDGCLHRLTIGAANPASTLQSLPVQQCSLIESSPTVIDDEYVLVGIDLEYGRSVLRFSIDPFEKMTDEYDVGTAECRTTPAYDGVDYAYVGADTGSLFHKVYAHDLSAYRGTAFEAYYWIGSAGLTTAGQIYIGNDCGIFGCIWQRDMSEAGEYNTGGIVCSSPAIGYNVDTAHNRWVYVTTRNGNGQLLAFKITRP